MKPSTESLANNHEWLRVADPEWAAPLDTQHSYEHGGRWNRHQARHTLYLCADEASARAQISRLLAGRFAVPEDLRDDFAVLLTAQLPDDQTVADIHTASGVAAVDLPPTYPLESDGTVVPPSLCQTIGDAVADQHLHGVHTRSATTTARAQDAELAWFPSPETRAEQSTPSRYYGEWR